MPNSSDPVRAEVDHLFRREAARMVSALVRLLGPANIDLAEDIVQDTLCRALSVWSFGGLPDNPGAWLMRAAKNRAIDVIRRQRASLKLSVDLRDVLGTEWALVPTVDAVFDEHEIQDGLLGMMFSCCHLDIAPDGQIALILKLLCGFGVREIASAFLVTPAAIEKRLTRAKATLARDGAIYVVAGATDLGARLESVQRALYLLFNEGYHASGATATTREELCDEAIRLSELLCQHPATAVPSSHALTALMYLHSSRLPARVADDGSLVLLDAQDRSLWDKERIARGLAHLEHSASGAELSTYHLEAAIAREHSLAEGLQSTDWGAITALYAALLAAQPSPVIALNHAIALARFKGPARGLELLERLELDGRLADYPHFHCAIGDLQRQLGQRSLAREAFERARALCSNPGDIAVIERKLAELAR